MVLRGRAVEERAPRERVVLRVVRQVPRACREPMALAERRVKAEPRAKAEPRD